MNLHGRISRRKLARLNRRRRKKLLVGEFTVWGVTMTAFPFAGKTPFPHVNDWADLVHRMGLIYGGATTPAFMRSFVEKGRNAAEPELIVEWLRQWLLGDGRFERVDLTEIYDVYDWTAPKSDTSLEV